MTEYTTDPAKKVKYIASILYLLVFAFIVGGSYFHQQQQAVNDSDSIVVIQTDKPLIE